MFAFFTNQLRHEGVGLDEAIRRAGEVRFLPIPLTAMTAIGAPAGWRAVPRGVSWPGR